MEFHGFSMYFMGFHGFEGQKVGGLWRRCGKRVLALKKKCCNPRIPHAWRLLISWRAMLSLQCLLSLLGLLAAGLLGLAGRRMSWMNPSTPKR